MCTLPVAGTRRGSRRAALVAALAAAVWLAACQGVPDQPGNGEPGSEEGQASQEQAPSTSAAPSWPGPDPDRPVVHLDYVVAEDHATVDGRERITFVPDLEVCEVVLRSWPNKPSTSEAGNALTVRQVLLDGAPAEHDEEPAGAPDGAAGTLVEVPLGECVPPGGRIELDVDFRVLLGEGTDERVGRDGSLGIAWLGTAYPVLAWQPGVGWARDDAVGLAGETTTSAAFELARLSVTAPADQQVAGVGRRTGTVEHGDGTRTSTFTAPVMRDVAVTVGDVEIHDLAARGTPVHLVVPSGLPQDRVEEWGGVVAETLRSTEDLLGDYPYDALWVSLLPVTEGVELTGAVQVGLGDPEELRWVVAHEIAHQWFYGLVGNNQAEHPWLDEAWSSAVQEIVAPVGWERGAHELPGALGWSMQEWDGSPDPDSAYVDTVYLGGASTLLELREEVGRQEWDAAVRAYLRDSAHTLAKPEDLRTALAGLPGVDGVLAEAGAWD